MSHAWLYAFDMQESAFFVEYQEWYFDHESIVYLCAFLFSVSRHSFNLES